jgi:uncharacterized membrane protein YhhN
LFRLSVPFALCLALGLFLFLFSPGFSFEFGLLAFLMASRRFSRVANSGGSS